MSERHIIYIVNPVSGGSPKKNLQKTIEKESSANKIPFDIFPSVANGDYSFLLPHIADKGTTDIVIAGGDGTVSQVVSSLMSSNLRFGIIPCGSGNGLAFTARIPRQTARALRVVWQNNESKVDGFFVNGRFAVHLCGVGFDAKVAREFAQQPGRGLSTYVKEVIKNFLSARAYSFDIELPGKSFKTEAFFISVANSNQFGNNFRIAPAASISDGLLDVVILTRQQKLSFLLQTIRQVAGYNPLQTGALEIGKRSAVYFQTDSLLIKNKKEAPLHIDGEPVETAKELKFQIKPACFRLLVP